MRTKNLYYLLAAAGVVVPWGYYIMHVMSGGSLAPEPFMAAATANAVTTAITWDVYIAAAAASVWMVADSRRKALPHVWPYVVLCFTVGLAFAWPLYMARRA